MLIETGKLVGAGLLDAASIPVIMMGFRLTESCVVVGLDGNQMAFCGRGDLEAMANEFLFRDYADQMLAAVDNSGVEALLLVGYSEDPAEAARLLDTLATRLSPHVAIGQCVVASQRTVWGVIGGYLDGSGVPFCLDDELNKVKDVLPDGACIPRRSARRGTPHP